MEFKQNTKKWHQNDKLLIVSVAIAFLAQTMIDAQPNVIDINNPSANDPLVDILQLRLQPNAANDGQMLNALKSNAANRWTKYRSGRSKYVIPFQISGRFSEQERQIIRQAMHAIDRNTCIRFVQRKPGGYADYVDIQNQSGQGCYTMVGRMAGNNLLMLESSGAVTCITHPTVVHELLHKVGLWHEQMRFDRDKHIRVHWENIPENLRSQFAKIPSSMSSIYAVPYDFRSVMHYAKGAFARVPGQLTMETKNRRYQNVIGHARTASRGDWSKICGMYKCARCMGKPFSTRQTGGNGGGRKNRRRQQRRRSGGNNNNKRRGGNGGSNSRRRQRLLAPSENDKIDRIDRMKMEKPIIIVQKIRQNGNEANKTMEAAALLLPNVTDSERNHSESTEFVDHNENSSSQSAASFSSSSESADEEELADNDETEMDEEVALDDDEDDHAIDDDDVGDYFEVPEDEEEDNIEPGRISAKGNGTVV